MYDCGVNPTLLWCTIALCVVGFVLLICCWGFLLLYSKILACNFFFFFGGVFVKFGILERLVEYFEKDRCKLFFVCLIEFPSEAIQSWSSVSREFSIFVFIIIDAISILVISLSISSWLSLGRLYVSRILSNSSRLSILLAYIWS